MVWSSNARSNASLRQISYVRAISLLTVIAILSFVSAPTVTSQQYSGKASISGTTYIVQEDSVALTVTVGYSYGTAQILKITVSTYTPAHDYEQIIDVGPGTGQKTIDFILKPKPSTESSTVTVSLYMSNANGDSLGLLAAKEVNIDMTNSGQPSWGGMLLVVGAIVLGSMLYFASKRGRKPKPSAGNRHHRKRKPITK